ncbi:hypothetical protein COU23_00295 [Candidatus Kuenenbacteria bacterium CG10_big_fil_rev_8_21_14_0_10_36_11]|uniref:Membrane fusion protein biotin-lipoyl like domain-containing protein n=1 Tax=Candidatus Kuenenbacteria bacterium CG10_big_fil_rev_8_21_14_0_10_36_11 TaxID=1974618 RepID=A0A2M6WBF3_9BACT|nr:MAG: hypothetical protein COU23_00295 [Candidatus Kuenenbacteria bacterium CG10_big_fil_rev_8_21_14_0_10_36_11]
MLKSKKKTIIIAIIILAVIGVIFAFSGSKNKTEYTTVKAEKMTLKQTVEATGQVESASAIKLNFKSAGRLEKIFVKEGDIIKAGAKLAQLESRALGSQVADARARLAQAQADYDKLMAGASEIDIQISENSVAQKEQSLITAINTLAFTEAKQTTELTNLKTAALDTLKSEVVTAKGALEEINNTLADPDAEDTLAIKNRTILKTAENNYTTAVDLINQSQTKNNLLNLLSGSEEIFLTLDDLKTALSSVAQALSDTMNVLEATLTSADLSETELDTLKTNIKTQQTKISSSLTNVQTAKSNLNSKITYYEDQVTYYENAVKDAENALSIAQAQLELKKSPARSFEIQSGRAKVDQTRANLDLALANLGEAQIIAPVNGIITKKGFEVGEQTSLATPVLEMIGETKLQIQVNVPEADIAKIKLSQNVAITLDAFGPDKKFMGQVIFIDPAETKIQDVVYYQVKIQFMSGAEEIKPGMTANLTIYTDSRDNVLVVPSRAVKSRDGEKYVEILTAEKNVTQKTVTVGLKGNEGIEILSGLNEGEEVITFVKK